MELRELDRLAPIEEANLPDPIRADWVTVVLDRQPPNIFLSYSGAQRDFVEQLCEDFERANQSPFFDKRPHSLPKGEKFAPLIFTAATECKVAVVVVSDEYFTRSKWPMLELAALVQAPECKIIPLFYRLSRTQFKDEENRERWFQVWHEWSKLDNRISVDVWKAALRSLNGWNGMEYVEANGEVSYRREVVTSACDRMRRISPDEIMVVERATSDVCEFDLPYQSCGNAVTRFNTSKFACLRMPLPVVFQRVAALFTILLLFSGYCHYFHDFNASPPDAVKSRPEGLSDEVRVNFSLPKIFNRTYSYPGYDYYWNPFDSGDHFYVTGYTTTPALQNEIYLAQSKYGQQQGSSLDGLSD